MPNTPALSAEYQRVIAAKFVTKRDGSPMHCMTCAAPLVMGESFAATLGDGAWHSYCATCAISPQAQIAGLVARVEELVTPLGDDVPQVVTLLVEQATPRIEQVFATGDVPAFLSAKGDLLAIRTAIGITKREVKQAALADNPTFAALQQIAQTGNDRDRGFAASLVEWMSKGKALTERQQAAADRMIAKSTSTTNGAAVTPVENGLYLHDDGTIRKLYTTQNDRQGCKVLRIHQSGIDETAKLHGSFEYVKGGTTLVAQAVADGTARLLTEAEASEFGKLHGFCCVCAIDLDDDRSLAVGYGPVCAKNNDWWYPTKAEAAAILNRPTEVAPMFEAIGYLTPDEVLGLDGGEVN